MSTSRVAIALVLGLAVCPLARADEEYDKLLAEFEQAQQQYFGQLQKLQTEGEGQDPSGPIDATALPPHPAAKFAARFRQYAERHAGKPEAIPALVWMISASGQLADDDQTQKEKPAEWALKRLTKDHAGQPEIKDELLGLKYAMYGVEPDGLVAFYEKIIRKNKDKDAVAGATFNLAYTLYQSPHLEDDAKAREASRQRAIKLFQKLVKEYPDTRAAKNAEGYIFEIEHLQIGMVAPGIVGKDANGKKIRLSQFRGQVVVLDFWGFW